MATPECWRVYEQRLDELRARRERLIEASALYYARHPAQIEERLAELDLEWDVPTVAGADLGLGVLTGVALGMSSGRWRLLAWASAAFLGYHAVKGESTVGAIYEMFGFRSRGDIERERTALKAVRGDFDGAGPASDGDVVGRASRALEASD